MELLSLYAQQQNRRLEIAQDTGSKNLPRYGYDAFAPEGFVELPSPTVIEITVRTSFPRLREKVEFLRRKIHLPTEMESILLVTARSSNPDVSARLNQELCDKSLKRIEIWGPEKLSEIASLFPEQVEKLFDSIFHLTIRNALSSSSKDWKSNREKALNSLANAYGSSQFSLFLGAGVSASAGMPDWGSFDQPHLSGPI